MIFRRLLLVLFALLFLQALSSCVYESVEDCPVDKVVAEEKPLVNLTFSVVAPSAADPDATRAGISPDKDNYFENGVDEYEMIHQLRVIIIRPNREVEHNRMVSVNNGAVRYDNLEFLVHSGEDKKIYLLANCEGIDYDFDRLKPGVSYTEPFIEDIVINASESNNTIIDNTGNNLVKKYIPMSEIHEVAIDKSEDLMKISDVKIGPLFITRASVKFSFSLSSDYGSGLFITGITVNKIADKEYFLPRDSEYSPPKGSDPILNWSGAVDPDLFGRFITKYSTPAAAAYSSVTFVPQTPVELGSDKTVTCRPALYYCESKYDSDNETPYSVSITVAEKDIDGNLVRPYTFVPINLPNLPNLPRNTHVKVKIRLGKNKIQKCEVEIVPYIGVNLNPEFGVDRDDPIVETP